AGRANVPGILPRSPRPGQALRHRFAQALFAPGAARALRGRVHTGLAQLPAAARVLDVGCGAVSRLADAGEGGRDLAALLPARQDGTWERIRYARKGLGGLWCTARSRGPSW